MTNKELEIPSTELPDNVQEDIILRSPSTIPDKGLRDLMFNKKINGSDCSYYDISPTENQGITKSQIPDLHFFPSQEENNMEEVFQNLGIDLKLGNINE